MVVLVWVLVICCIVFVSIYAKSRKLKKYPPGPFSLPIIGNLHQLSAEAHCDFIKLQEKYGRIFSIGLGPQRTVILNDYKDVKEVMAQQACSGRPELPHLYDPHENIPRGITFGEGKHWEEQRRFALKNLRDLGFGKESMETMMHEEIKELLESLRKDIGKPICTTTRFTTSVFNALWRIVAGERFSDTLNSGKDLLYHITEITRSDRSFTILGFFKSYTKFFPKLTGLTNFKANFIPILHFMGEIVKSHKETFQPGQSRDFLDQCLEQIYKTNDASSSFYKKTGGKIRQMVP